MSTNDSADKKHISFGEKLKGAAHVVHGIGEDIRGSVMGAFESVSGSEEAKAKNEGIAAKGKAEIEQGVARMKGVEAPQAGGATAAAPESRAETKTGDQPQEQLAKTDASDAIPVPPPGPVQSQQAESETSRQEPIGQTGSTGVDSAQQSSQESQVASETKTPQVGEDNGPSAGGADVPQEPVGGV